jgi:Exopolysaccharide synthesis, ExoD
MLTEIIVPTIADAGPRLSLGRWFKRVGDPVTSGEPLVEIDTDNVTHEIAHPSQEYCRKSSFMTAARSKPAPCSEPSASIEAKVLVINSGAILVPPPIVDARTLVSASVVLQRLHDEVPPDHFTLGWLMDSLQKRSFGIIMLLLALVAIAPGISIAAGILVMIPAFQMIAGKPAPVFPHRIANHGLAASLNSRPS